MYHKHSTATQESSRTWNTLVSRSRNLYDYIKDYSENNDPDQCKSYNTSLNYEGIPSVLESKLIKLDNSIKNQSVQDLVFDGKTAVGIYNSYWSSMGGGEKHALDFAHKFNQCKNTKVYLISEREFSISELSDYFDLDLSGCKKIVTGEVTKAFTKRFDIFINSTYRSNLVSESPNSFYVVSFPHKNISKELVASYTFLHNSNFTSSWAKKYWGEHQSKTIMPIQQFSTDKNEAIMLSKEKICLSVGRFNYMGHCKNQHLIIQAFNKAICQFDGGKDWKLIVVGSVDNSSNSSVEHYKDCQRMAGDNIEVIANIDREDLSKLYKKASIYIHGTGMNIDSNQEPHLCEHFGITVFEALFNGCFPIVHNSAGPKDQAKGLKYSRLFTSREQLTKQIVDTISSWEKEGLNQTSVATTIKNHAQSMLSLNEKNTWDLVSTVEK